MAAKNISTFYSEFTLSESGKYLQMSPGQGRSDEDAYPRSIKMINLERVREVGFEVVVDRQRLGSRTAPVRRVQISFDCDKVLVFGVEGTDTFEKLLALL